MKVFLSWPGEQSHKVALVFRDPKIIECKVNLQVQISNLEDLNVKTVYA